MVGVEELDCLDCTIWLRTEQNSAGKLNLNQSTVSRNIRKVKSVFAIDLTKAQGEWVVTGDTTLLDLERQAHQAYRWQNGRDLRIDAQYYSGPLFFDPVPEGWTTGNFDYLEIHTPLRHLRTGVMDAWIGCHPDVPDPTDEDLTCFHLTRMPTYLVVAPGHPLLKLGNQVTMEDVHHYPSLALEANAFPKVQAALTELGLWNSPSRMKRYRFEKWEGRTYDQLTVGYATSFSIRLFPGPQVILPIEVPLEVGDTLIVHRNFCDHPRLAGLLLILRQRAQELATQYHDVRLA